MEEPISYGLTTGKVKVFKTSHSSAGEKVLRLLVLNKIIKIQNFIINQIYLNTGIS